MNYYDELYHYGVKGQKWGVRRYQRKDGTLTEAGKKRIKEAGNLNFPAYDKKRRKYVDSVEFRTNIQKNLSDRKYEGVLADEREKLMRDYNRSKLKKAGYNFTKNPDSDVREHNEDIITKLLMESPVVKEARLKNLEDYIDRYANATLHDLGLKNTNDQAVEFTKKYLKDSSKSYNRLFEEVNTQSKMSDAERQKEIDNINKYYQKKWDKLNERYMKAVRGESSESPSEIDLEFDLVDASWLYELDEMDRR